MDETWKTVERLREWLDAESPLAPDVTRIMHVLKITEEAGEVAEAMPSRATASVYGPHRPARCPRPPVPRRRNLPPS